MSETAAAPGPAVAQALLSEVRRAPVTVEKWERLEPWALARAWLAGAGAEQTVIVKWVRTGASQVRTERWRLGAELAALRFLSDDLGLGIAPRVLAADLRAGFLVLQDLAPRVPLDLLVRRDGAAAHLERIGGFARALGELGAATAGREDRYRTTAPDTQRHFATLWSWTHQIGSLLEAPLTAQVGAELAAVLDELHSPGPFLALSHGDAEFNNILVHESGPADARLIDFEAAGYSHALLDAVGLHVPGPAWLTVGEPSAGGVAGHYRRALAVGIPQAQDDGLYGFGLAAACASWALLRLQRFAVLDARSPGDDSRLQLVETLESAARTAEAHHALPHLAGWLKSAARVLRRRWPDADLDLTDTARFPPYCARR